MRPRAGTEAPAAAAPSAASAISSGVTGRCGDIDGVWIAPVTAQVMMTLRACAAMMESRDWQALQVLDVAVDADCLAGDVARGR